MPASSNQMKVGIQTIVWEEWRSKGEISRPEILKQAQEAEYDGIELFEPPNSVDLRALASELSDRGLCLTGLTGGSFQDRYRLAKKWVNDKLPGQVPYLYCDEKPNKFLNDALDNSFSVGLHPHMFKPVQTLAEACTMLSEYRQVFAQSLRACPIHLMPDTAHCYIAGDDIMEAVRHNLDAIECIHLKDWIPEFGRSYQFYARGFVPLGQGDVKIDVLLNFLKEKRYSGWLIVEVDHPDDPMQAAQISREYLRTFNI